MMARVLMARAIQEASMLSGVYRFPPMESVSYRRPFAEALNEQVEQSGAPAVFLLASGTVARETGLVGQVRDALGNRLAGVHARVGAHTPRTDVVEAAATLQPPEGLFLSAGTRAVDHAGEDSCSPECQPISEGASYHALKLLGRGLLGVKADPLDLEARLECQLGAWMSMVGSQTGVPNGASHGIGHVLCGTADVPHGYPSCVLRPHLLRS